MHSTSCTYTPNTWAPSFTQTGAFHLISLIRSLRPWGVWPKLACVLCVCVQSCDRGSVPRFILAVCGLVSGKLPSESSWLYGQTEMESLVVDSLWFTCAITRSVTLKGANVSLWPYAQSTCVLNVAGPGMVSLCQKSSCTNVWSVFSGLWQFHTSLLNLKMCLVLSVDSIIVSRHVIFVCLQITNLLNNLNGNVSHSSLHCWLYSFLSISLKHNDALFSYFPPLGKPHPHDLLLFSWRIVMTSLKMDRQPLPEGKFL